MPNPTSAGCTWGIVLGQNHLFEYVPSQITFDATMKVEMKNWCLTNCELLEVSL
jgi:hypothetical protein